MAKQLIRDFPDQPSTPGGNCDEYEITNLTLIDLLLANSIGQVDPQSQFSGVPITQDGSNFFTTPMEAQFAWSGTQNAAKILFPVPAGMFDAAGHVPDYSVLHTRIELDRPVNGSWGIGLGIVNSQDSYRGTAAGVVYSQPNDFIGAFTMGGTSDDGAGGAGIIKNTERTITNRTIYWISRPVQEYLYGHAVVQMDSDDTENYFHSFESRTYNPSVTVSVADLRMAICINHKPPPLGPLTDDLRFKVSYALGRTVV